MSLPVFSGRQAIGLPKFAGRRNRRAGGAAGNWYDAVEYDLLAAGADLNGDRYFLPPMGANLVTNHDFLNGDTGWAAGAGTISNGEMMLDASLGSSWPMRSQTNISLVLGKTYRISARARKGDAGSTTLQVGTNTGSTQLTFTSTTYETKEGYWVARGTEAASIILQLASGSAVGTGYIDWVKIEEVFLDREGLTYGSELIDNGTMSSAAVADPSQGWVLKSPATGTETMTISGGTLNLTGDGTNSAYADQNIVTQAGKTYELVLYGTTNAANVRVGTVQNGSDLLSFNTTVGAVTVVRFAATGSLTWIRFVRTSTGTVNIDNVSIREVTNSGTRYAKRSATFNEWFAFTASSTAARTYTAQDGTIKNDLAANAPRFDWRNGKRQLRLEDARTNAYLNSNDLTNATYWTPEQATLSSAVYSGLTLWTLTESTGSGLHRMTIPSGSSRPSVATGTHTMSAHIRQGTRRYFDFGWLSGANGCMVRVDTQTMTIVSGTSFQAGTATYVSSKITQIGTTGTYRVELTFSVSASTQINATPTMCIDASTGLGGTNSRVGDGTSTMIIGGFQVEAGNFATDYIPTTTAAITRAAEAARGSPLIEAIFARSSVTVVERSQGQINTSSPAGYNMRIIGGLTVSDRIIGTSFEGKYTSPNATETLVLTYPLPAHGGAWACDGAGQSLCYNGRTPITSATVPTMNRTQFWLGREVNANPAFDANGWYDFIGISPERVNDNQLQAWAVAA